jgi:hypothetical protein
MATAKKTTDEFPNIVYVGVTESAANTLTFQQIQTGYGSLQKTGWVVHRIEYYLTQTTIQLLLNTDDLLQLALCTSNLASSLTLQDASMIDLLEIGVSIYSSVGVVFSEKPMIRNFSDLPGGGRLVLPYPLFLAVKGTSVAAAMVAAARIFFTERELGDSEWMELVQQTRLLS